MVVVVVVLVLVYRFTDNCFPIAIPVLSLFHSLLSFLVHHQFTFGGCVMSSSSLDSSSSRSSRSSKWNFLCPVVRESATAAAAAEQVRNRELWYGQSISHNFRGNNKLYVNVECRHCSRIGYYTSRQMNECCCCCCLR